MPGIAPGAVCALSVLTALMAFLPGLRFAVPSPDLRIALEVLELCVALFTVLALLLPEGDDLGPVRRAFVAALSAMAVSSAIVAAGSLDIVDADPETMGALAFLPRLAGSYVGGGLILAALARPGLLRRWHYPAAVVGGLGVSIGVALAMGPRVPLVVSPDVPGGWAAPVALPLGGLLTAASPGLLFAAGAWLAWRMSARSGTALYSWLTLGLVAQSFSHLHAMVYRITLGPVVTSVDLLRALALVLFLAGALLRIRGVIADRRATVEAQAADLRAHRELLATVGGFAESEEVFRSVVVHELATPIATMGAFAHALDRHAGTAWPPQARAALAGIRGESQRLQKLVARMDELRRLELDDFSCDLRPTPLWPFATEAARYVHGLPGSHTAIVECPEDLRALADPVLLGQALRDVLSNAAAYSPRGAPVLIACEAEPGGGVRVRVEDEGPGVPAEDRQRLLRKHERGAHSHNGNGSSGLGLYVARRIAEAHGGQLCFEEPRRLHGACVLLQLREASSGV